LSPAFFSMRRRVLVLSAVILLLPQKKCEVHEFFKHFRQ